MTAGPFDDLYAMRLEQLGREHAELTQRVCDLEAQSPGEVEGALLDLAKALRGAVFDAGNDPAHRIRAVIAALANWSETI